MTIPGWLRRGAPGLHAQPTSRARRAVLAPRWIALRRAIAAAAAALMAMAGLGWGTAAAAFRATSGGGSNSWVSGTVTFGASNPATALFTVTGAVPGSTGNACVKLTYTGSLPAQVRLYVGAGDLTGTGLADYLTLQINEGSGSNADCSDFVQSANAYNATGTADSTKTLAAFAGASTNHATGVSAWDNVATNATRTYQLVYFLQPDNAAISKTATVTFTWAAQS